MRSPSEATQRRAVAYTAGSRFRRRDLAKIILLHWNDSESRERARQLRDAGHTVVRHIDRGSPSMRRYRQNPPQAFVIDLTRLPAEGAGVAAWLRQQKTLQSVPLVLVGCSAEKEERIRRTLPDATFAPWSRIRSALKSVLRAPVQDPVVPPDTMAGYSGTPLPRKLGIKPASRVTLIGAPRDFATTLGALPPDVVLRSQTRGKGERTLLFARSVAELVRRFPAATRTVDEGGHLWILWPKQASGMATDLTQNHVRQFGLQQDWVDFKICAVDQTWSGLCFARRKK